MHRVRPTIRNKKFGGVPLDIDVPLGTSYYIVFDWGGENSKLKSIQYVTKRLEK